MAEVDLDEEVIELSAEEPRSDNTNEIATKDFMNGERSRESIHNHWQFSDEGPIEYESDPSSDIDKNYFSDQESLTGSMDGGLEEDEYTSDPIARQTRQEKLQHLALRRHLDKLSEQVLEKDYLVSQFREELKKCEDHIEELQKQKEMVNSEIEEAESQNNMASLYRLQGFDSKLCAEIDAEKDVHRDIFHRLQEAEFALAQATVEQGKFLLAGNELEKQDKLVEKQKADQSAVRLRKENMSAVVSDRRRRAREKEHISALRERERKHRQAIAAAKRNREQASKFLKETMSRVRQKETEEEERSREYMQDRMQAILSLKNNIETNKNTYTIYVVFQSWGFYVIPWEMMENALMKQRAGIVQKQIAVGREFKGCAFYSKPEVITFKDFDVGKSYKKKILLTNISYTQNYCKYVGMSHILKDFVEVFFEPPGVMSAGLTCDFTVTFKPMLNEDLEGHIDFLAQTGPFSVPIRCVTKKCQISVDVTEVEFGSQVLGETRKRVINVTNNGALGT
ncbi:PREDICTED: cilia- and flagella-associated protein 74-like, partial [Acropora digitifera]|uniref:cilia- and flagella-associated protein 74-like n=1 Tax=Acropora digitifera TaxID=70779 RepID=UPI00077A0198